jgi:quercetin dioxygenase-like cupin family protein
MHKHTADQQFYCVKGECTFHFPDGSARKLTPGMLVTNPARQLYQLDNTGDECDVSRNFQQKFPVIPANPGESRRRTGIQKTQGTGLPLSR